MQSGFRRIRVVCIRRENLTADLPTKSRFSRSGSAPNERFAIQPLGNYNSDRMKNRHFCGSSFHFSEVDLSLSTLWEEAKA
jgi:hypothetical protein